MQTSPLPPIEKFIGDQLGWIDRRATDEEKAVIAWWRSSIATLAKQAPKPAAAPVARPRHPHAA